ncbi:hypothetical protein AGLY_015848 [Aphis glycines]|uniref:Uncharacterized protein n=1 Tax=Aphis glycines TaxID=307491 RepID=A0A6G0T059_APHGL|nr:hypothetical protein AGLY_015848 [Aphis glycines]
MKEDFDLATAKNTRRALKALGVRTFIPHTVAINAMIKTELYLVDFLQIIKDYVIQKNNEKFYDRSTNTKKDYLPEERILMSSILHIAYPCFIKRLDYFLKDAIPKKNLEYIKLPKSTKSTKNYASPYLEPLPEPRHLWNKVKEVKFHNMNVRKQMMYNKMKTIQLQKKLEKELHDKKYITMRMKMASENSMNKMFCKPPLLKQFKKENENKLISEIKRPIVKSYFYDTFNEDEHLSYDPAKFCMLENLPSELVDFLLKKRHSHYVVLERNSRKKNIKRDWLSYSILSDKLFCLHCILFGKNSQKAWTKDEFSSWSRAILSI